VASKGFAYPVGYIEHQMWQKSIKIRASTKSLKMPHVYTFL